MISAPPPENEDRRLKELLKYEVLDSDDEQVFDELTQLASDICGAPISLVSLIDKDRQWFKSKLGLDATETSRSVAFCSHAILQEDVFEVPNAQEDERFADNPLVTGQPDIRFYAGAPLITKSGYALGTLCVIDKEPRQLSDIQKRALKTLSKQVVSQLDLRLQNRHLKRLSEEREKIYAMLAHDLRSPFNAIIGLSRILGDSAEKLGPEQISSISQEILGSSLDFYQLLDEILQWSQKHMGSEGIALDLYPLEMLVEQSAEILKEAMRLKSIELDMQIRPGAQVKADAMLTKTVIRNLLTNAIKYSPVDSKIVVSSRNEDGMVILRVEDNGVGVPEKLRDKLFSAPVMSHEGTAGEIGHGLGLRLSYDFVEMQGGSIRLVPEVTQGTAIEVTLPQC